MRCIGLVVKMQLAELALNQQADEGVRQAAALALACLSVLDKFKVTDISAALCRCLLTDCKQVAHLHFAHVDSYIHQLCMQRLLHNN